MTQTQLREELLNILVRIGGEEEVRTNSDVQLFQTGLLDSMGLVELLVEIEDNLQITVPITDFDRDEWATPNKIIAYLERQR